MSLLNLTPPSIGQPNATEDVDVVNAFNAIQTLINGNLDEPNLTTAILQRLGLNGSGTVGRGKANIPATESRTNVAYGTLGTADQVAGVVLPTDGLIAVAYQATWQQSVGGAGNAAIFLGANQTKIATGNVAAPGLAVAVCDGAANIDVPLATGPGGLMGFGNAFATAYTGDVTTGQHVGNADYGGSSHGNPIINGAPLGGPCYIFATAGTYSVSVQFKSSSGSVTAKNRRLWVWTVGF